MIEKVIINYIKKHNLLNQGDKVLIGVSGGIDSVALLEFFISISTEYNLDIAVAHINHSLRFSADKDEEFVKNICQEEKISFYSTKVDIKNKSLSTNTSIEEAGRNARYDFYNEICNKYDYNKVALAHHKDDQAETIFMRIIRGTGIKGLRGILPARDNIIRPFLCLSKSEIINYCRKHKLTYREDESNKDIYYHRNKLRIDTIPYMTKLNSNFKENIVHLGDISNEYYDYIRLQVNDAKASTVINNSISLDKYKVLHPIIKKELLIDVLNNNGVDNIKYNYVEIIQDMIDEDKNTIWELHLSSGMNIIRKYNNLTIEKRKENIGCQYSYDVLLNKVYLFSNLQLILKTCVKERKEVNFIKNNLVGYFDYDKIIKIKDSFILRNRQDGDKISPQGMEGSKKIKDILIEKKIPIDERWKIPILTVNNEILWVLGFHKSKKYSINDLTKKVIEVSFEDIKEGFN